jgi:hypothetical protein
VTRTFVIATWLLIAPLANAAVEIDLTPIGAERAGNAAGTIPPWTGGITVWPENYRKGSWHVDPFIDDERLFVISANNVEEHRDQLTPGQIKLLETYPTWQMPVYPTQRSASYPAYVYEAIKANEGRAVLVTEGKGGVRESRITSPFRRPASGVEVIWNHNLRWRGVRVFSAVGTAAVTRRGNYQIVSERRDIGLPYAAPDGSSFKARYPGIFLAFKAKTIEPVLISGNGTLVLEPIEQTHNPRKVWQYSRGLRRVVRLPFFAYDFPARNTDALRTVDDFGLFIGPPDRFDWKLLGKREIYIPYNAYQMHAAATPKELIGRHHINPEFARYELHRVWVVEGTLKPGERHIYGKRVFYVDEDSWQISAADTYDLDGNLWRAAESHGLNYYEVPLHWSTLEVFYDFQAERYLAEGLDNGRRPPRFAADGDPREFSPNALTYYVR